MSQDWDDTLRRINENEDAAAELMIGWQRTRATFTFGRDRDGWCCAVADCHKTFEHRNKPRRTFARMMLHRALRHRLLWMQYVPSVSRVCRVTHSVPRQTYFATATWTASAAVTWAWTPLDGPDAT